VQLSVSAWSLNFLLIRIYSFGDIAIFIFCRFGLKLPIHAHFDGVLGACSPSVATHRSNNKRTILGRNTSFEPYENRSSCSTWAQDREKVRTGQDRTGQSKKSQCGNISHIWEAPTVPIKTKIFMVGILADLITCKKFQDDIFMGYSFTWGRIFYFLLYTEVSRGDRILQIETGFWDIFNSEKGRTSRIEVLWSLDRGLVSKRPRCRNVDARTWARRRVRWRRSMQVGRSPASLRPCCWYTSPAR